MQRVYSLDEAKTRLSEVIRQVRAGHEVTISVRGKVVAAHLLTSLWTGID